MDSHDLESPGWKMLMTFQFTVRYKWSERKAPVPCTCFKIRYSFSMQKQKNDTNEVSVHVGVHVHYQQYPNRVTQSILGNTKPDLFSYRLSL